ncbi:nucleic acid-binding, OB-fold-like protein isoform X2 [Tasmannia lanceolata]|uniref:nucleic acid-binding, OB-fold-like protein isoform X2 n=1 Tax=Tasmannia lanceolata TaxID=3420 RepID=UPI0040645B64
MESKGTETESIVSKRNKAMVYALCKHLSLDPKNFSSESSTQDDIKSLFLNILQLSENGVILENKDEVMNWVEFAESFPTEGETCHAMLKEFNEKLTQRSVLLGYGLKPSEVDIVVFSALHFFVSHLSNLEKQKFPNVLRWMDYIQNKEDFGELFEIILVEKPKFEFHVSKSVNKLEVDPNSKRSVPASKNTDKLEVGSTSNTSASEKKEAIDSKSTVEKKKISEKVSEEKKKVSEKVAVEKDTEASVSVLNIQVGVIRKAWKHPSADSLLVEEIDLGDGNLRQVVSGLAKYCSPEKLMNRRVALVANVKPGKLRDVMSAGLVLCASNQDHTVVEPLLPPEGAILGERVLFSGIFTPTTRVWQHTKEYHS